MAFIHTQAHFAVQGTWMDATAVCSLAAVAEPRWIQVVKEIGRRSCGAVH